MASRKIAHAIRPGYRLHRKDIPGNPDIAYIGRKQAVFVHGCFWHGHDCARGARVPKANRDYWTQKIARNRARDEEALRRLEAEGWDALVVWECALKDRDALRARLREFLGD
jgi:DNA mismatch endonuclease (patch repair protein)